MTGGTMWICSAVILLLTWEVEAFPTGAPNYVCGGMRPTHPGVQQPDDTLPYGIVLTSRTTMPGDVVTATVTVLNADVPVNGQTMRISFFKGIMSTVVDAQNMRIPGYVQPPPDSNLQILNCTSTQGEVPDTAITHRDGTQWEFNSKSFDWRIPQNIPVGTELTMRFTIVYNTSIYWVAIPRTFTVGTPMMPVTPMTPRPPTTGPQPVPVTPMPPTMPTSRPTGPVQPTGPGAQPTTGNNVGTTGLVNTGAGTTPGPFPPFPTGPLPSGPTAAPPVFPTAAPPVFPTAAPPVFPTAAPPVFPTAAPPVFPTAAPPVFPTAAPPVFPTAAPPVFPTAAPPVFPTAAPPVFPTAAPPTEGVPNGGEVVPGEVDPNLFPGSVPQVFVPVFVPPAIPPPRVLVPVFPQRPFIPPGRQILRVPVVSNGRRFRDRERDD